MRLLIDVGSYFMMLGVYDLNVYLCIVDRH